MLSTQVSSTKACFLLLSRLLVKRFLILAKISAPFFKRCEMSFFLPSYIASILILFAFVVSNLALSSLASFVLSSNNAKLSFITWVASSISHAIPISLVLSANSDFVKYIVLFSFEYLFTFYCDETRVQASMTTSLQSLGISTSMLPLSSVGIFLLVLSDKCCKVSVKMHNLYEGLSGGRRCCYLIYCLSPCMQ